MVITFIIALHHIEVTENLGRGEKIDNITFISNEKSVVKKLIPKDTINIIGELEYIGLINAKAFIYSTEELPVDTTPENYLIDRLFYIQTFLSAIWIKMDNNIDFELGFVFCNDDGKLGVSSNYLAVSYYNPQLKPDITILSRDELREIRTLFREKLAHIKNSHINKKETQLLKKHSRFEMALYHIQVARAESDIGLKISNYCSALETLFSTSQTELAHQLSERLAYFISETPEERIENYKKSKQAYTIRSKVVHGSYIKDNNLTKIKELAIFCDSSLRVIITKLMSDDQLYKNLSNNELLDEYMLKLVLGVH